MTYVIQDATNDSVNILRIEDNRVVEICSIYKRPSCKISANDLAEIMISEMNRLYKNWKEAV